MGYTTDFRGSWTLNKQLDLDTFKLLEKLHDQRHDEPESEFRGTPGIWCQWVPSDDGMEIMWDGGEKFYDYVDWIEYIISKILAPRGYILNGKVEWRGEEWGDTGYIVIENNNVLIEELESSREESMEDEIDSLKEKLATCESENRELKDKIHNYGALHSSH